MKNRLQMYEQHLVNSHHYRRLLQAKSTLVPPQNRQRSRSSRVSPLDQYQYDLTNDKIRKTLVAIYQHQGEHKKRRPHRRKNKGLVFSTLQVNKDRAKTIDRQNIKMFDRIVSTSSTIGHNWKKREKQLKKYSTLTRKHIQPPDDSLFHAFRQTLVESRAKKGRSLRSKSKNSSKCQNRAFSARSIPHQPCNLAQTL